MRITFPPNKFPVSPQTISAFTDQIVQPLLSGQSVTFVFPHFQGGERAWIRFLFDHPQATNFHASLANFRLLCFDPTEVIDSSQSAFLYHLLSLLSPDTPEYTKLSQEQLLIRLRKTLATQLKHQEIVIFFLKLNSFPGLTPILGNQLYSLWRPHKRRLHFVTTITPESILSQLPELIGDFSEAITENIRHITGLSDIDILHSILHWEHILDHQLSSSEKSAIVKYSQGSPYISKILIQNLCQPYIGLPETICKHLVSQHFNISKKPGPISQIPTTVFTPQELAVIRLLSTKASKVVNRDEIAIALWGNKSEEKYSDWAIDKFISLVRQKMQDHNCSSRIVTLKQQGYILEI